QAAVADAGHEVLQRLPQLAGLVDGGLLVADERPGGHAHLTADGADGIAVIPQGAHAQARELAADYRFGLLDEPRERREPEPDDVMALAHRLGDAGRQPRLPRAGRRLQEHRAHAALERQLLAGGTQEGEAGEVLVEVARPVRDDGGLERLEDGAHSRKRSMMASGTRANVMCSLNTRASSRPGVGL